MPFTPKKPLALWQEHSEYAKRWLQRYPEWLVALSPELDLVDATRAFLDGLPISDQDSALKKTLRLARQRIMLEIMRRDLQGMATLNDVMLAMTLLADYMLETTCRRAHSQLAQRYGEPADGDGLLIVGMGKLGGAELNVSSDVDLVFLYGVEGETTGGNGLKSISHSEFFTLLAKKIIGLLADVTEDGFVFRVDTRLRPNGDSGPLVASLDMLEEYFLVQGREWERYAWIKARVVNSPISVTHHADAFALHQKQLDELIQPFVYRKYLDFGVIRALRSIHQQIKQEATKREAQPSRGGVHVKLGRGGIREIEFIAQVFQLIRGGRESALRGRKTVEMLERCTELSFIPADVQVTLCEAYEFWRYLEHRLQYVDDAQTHILPSDDEQRRRIALSMGYDDLATFDRHVETWQRYVSVQFDEVFGDKQEDSFEEKNSGIWPDQFNSTFKSPEQAQARWNEFKQSGRYRSLPAAHQERLNRLLPNLVKGCAEASDPDACWNRCCALLEAIARRGAYLSLLDEYPTARNRVIRILAASGWASEFLRQHPLLLDELLDEQTLYALPNLDDYESELRKILSEAVLANATEPDVERRMDLTREFHHAQLFRLLAQDLDDQWSVERISDHISALADRTLKIVLDETWALMPQRHCEHPQFAIIAYGKLGGKELGYASDLDLIFIYDDEDEHAPELYSRLATRFSRWISAHTPAGVLFDTDYRLRPNGEAGLLVTSFAAFKAYQRREGGVGAWLWEHQALTRARFCVGDAILGTKFEEERKAILQIERNWNELRQEVLDMRERMHQANTIKPEVFDLKLDPGGMVDIEFIVQTLVLRYSHAHATLTENKGNIALLKRCAGLGLIDSSKAYACANIYRDYRAAQHALRLAGSKSSGVEENRFVKERLTVTALWNEVFQE